MESADQPRTPCLPGAQATSQTMRCSWPSLRNALLIISTILGLSLVLLIIHQVILPILGWLIPSLVPGLYDLAVYGAYPTHEYVTFDLQAPSPSIIKWDDSCDNGYVLVSPFGNSVPDAGPMILDSRANLVWMSVGYGHVMNLKVQQYLNEPHLTFWAGRKVGGIGQGDYLILNSSYDIVKKVSATSPPGHPDDIRVGDLHDFVLTDSGTSMLTVYNTTNYDLSAMNRPTKGWIVDSLFQEVDVSTSELLFEWRASDHFDPATSSKYMNPFGGYSESNPYDFFHINSVQKDRNGDYMISSRHLQGVMTVSGKSGEVLWVLGGQFNVFDDLSDGKATSFTWQHDARWIDEEAGILSLFDNGSAGPIMTDAHESKALIIQVDLEKKTAKLLQSYTSRDGVLSASQGSVQIVDHSDTFEQEKHVLVGWGSSAAYSEFSMSGELLCETHLSASSLYWWERVKSYRAIKTFEWIGRPAQPPAALMSNERIYVSWNGATEVGAWQLEGRKEGAGEDEWQTIDIKEKEGFEDTFTLPDETFTAYRIAALGHGGRFLRHSDVVGYAEAKASRVLLWLIGMGAGVGAVVGVWLFMSRVPRGQKRSWVVWDRHRYRKVPGIEMN